MDLHRWKCKSAMLCDLNVMFVEREGSYNGRRRRISMVCCVPAYVLVSGSTLSINSLSWSLCDTVLSCYLRFVLYLKIV